jgi:hypothetical protein
VAGRRRCGEGGPSKAVRRRQGADDDDDDDDAPMMPARDRAAHPTEGRPGVGVRADVAMPAPP